MTEIMPDGHNYHRFLHDFRMGNDVASGYGDVELAPPLDGTDIQRFLYLDSRLRYVDAFLDIQIDVEAIRADEPDFIEADAVQLDTFATATKATIEQVRRRFIEEAGSDSEAPGSIKHTAIMRWLNLPQRREALERILADQEFDESSQNNMTKACLTTLSAITEGLWAILQITERLEHSESDPETRQSAAERVQNEFARIENELAMAHEGLQATDDLLSPGGNS